MSGHAERDHIAQEVIGSLMRWSCTICGEVSTQPNKGMGRANLAAWASRHQHGGAA